ncbi:MAG: bifunctional glutamate--cysteine ligase GshA/glutathione synthetase GshB [Chlamydiia bacterium]|nr:bifunctional glutamate--cysteine ligase GshA/glutathione synthetase GshB [Chlamydiia bacterium]
MVESFFKKYPSLANAFRIGLEREALRIDSRGTIAKTPHPKAFGSSLTHPYISTDFAEQQLELNTPPQKSSIKTEKFLENLIHFCLVKNPKELFWPFSMPPHLNHIEIASYGRSHEGKKKKIYREGLSCRYGKNLQMISGIHYNFSLKPIFWKTLHRHEKSSLPLKEYINKRTLDLIRNFLREGWILTYLFGSSPIMDPSYAPNQAIGPYATSIRTSHLGYYSRVQNQLPISFNSFEEYLKDMHYMLNTPKKEYTSIPLQLNHNLFQIPNEHYSRIRPKAIPHQKETYLDAIEKRGIEYVEVRSIDLDPFHPTGISPEQLDFLYSFLIYSLFKKSPLLSKEDQHSLTSNQDKVALEGRREGLMLQKGKRSIPLQKWGLKILKEMEGIGNTKNLFLQKEKMVDPTLTPSAIIYKESQKRGFIKMGLDLAKLHKKKVLSSTRTVSQNLEKIAAHSLIENKRLETASEILVDGYEDLELSTQILIQKALEWNIHVEILDRKDQLIRLEKKGHVEYVKEATKTSKDSYVTFHLLENKEMTKKLLKKSGLAVPEGKRYHSIEEALNDYPLFSRKNIVIKPKLTNFGLGISFIHPHDHSGYHKALKKGFAHGNTVLVEEFCPGKEFRFLIIDGKCIGIAKRIPANIIGDGKSTIEELVHAKNHDPDYYRDPKTYLHLAAEEKKRLKSLRLTPKSIIKKGRRVTLRYNSNVSTGGDAIDMTDYVHPGYKQIAIEAAKAIGANICGADILLTHPKDKPTPKNHTIIELNHNPVLFIHAYPYKGVKRDVATPLLHFLGYSACPSSK